MKGLAREKFVALTLLTFTVLFFVLFLQYLSVPAATQEYRIEGIRIDENFPKGNYSFFATLGRSEVNATPTHHYLEWPAYRVKIFFHNETHVLVEVWRFLEERREGTLFIELSTRRINGTDERTLWWISKDAKVGGTILIGEENFEVVSRGIHNVPEWGKRECLVLKGMYEGHESMVLYDLEFGVLLYLLTIESISKEAIEYSYILVEIPRNHTSSSPGSIREVRAISTSAFVGLLPITIFYVVRNRREIWRSKA